MLWDLACVDDDSESFTLDPDDTLRVGSDGGVNDVHVKNTFVSRSHALLVPRDDGKHYLMDVGSTNGTFVGGVRLRKNEPQSLVEGDVIAFGSSSSGRDDDDGEKPLRYEYKRSSETDPKEVSRRRLRESFDRSFVNGMLAERGIFRLY